MAKVYFDSDIQALSGKLGKNGNASYARNKKTGKCYRYEYNEDTKKSNTTDQQAIRDAFEAKSKDLSVWWNANKQVKSSDGTVTQQQSDHMTELLQMYGTQNKYGNPYTYARSLVTKDLKIALKSGSYTLINDSGSSSSTTPSGSDMTEEV